MYNGLVEFACWVAVISTATAFVLGLASKWGWLEWLQVHAPTEWLNKLFNCKFCCSWWVSLALSVIACICFGAWKLLAVPVCATVISRELW